MTIYHGGWDFFTPNAGECTTMLCRVCGEEMAVERDVFGPRGYVAHLAEKLQQRQDPTYRGGSLHDVFTCNNVGQKWHSQVRHLRKEQQGTRSAALQAMLEQEIRQILTTRRPTTTSRADVDPQTLPEPTSNGAPHGLL